MGDSDCNEKNSRTETEVPTRRKRLWTLKRRPPLRRLYGRKPLRVCGFSKLLLLLFLPLPLSLEIEFDVRVVS